MSFILHVVSEASLDKWTLKNTLSGDISIFIGENTGILQLVMSQRTLAKRSKLGRGKVERIRYI